MITAATRNGMDVPDWVALNVGLALAEMQAANDDDNPPNPTDAAIKADFDLATLRGVKINNLSSLLLPEHILPEHIPQAANNPEHNQPRLGANELGQQWRATTGAELRSIQDAIAPFVAAVHGNGAAMNSAQAQANIAVIADRAAQRLASRGPAAIRKLNRGRLPPLELIAA